MEEENNPVLAALRRQIREQEKENPHIAAQIASRIILDKLLAILKDDSGVLKAPLPCLAHSRAMPASKARCTHWRTATTATP